MATTTSELQGITRELNGVRSAGQAKAAIGAVLIAITGGHAAATRAEQKGFPWVAPAIVDSARYELEQARFQLEEWYRAVKIVPDHLDYAARFSEKKALIFRGYNAVAGAEGIADYTPSTSNLDILRTSILQAPGVFLEQATAAAVAVAKSAGNVAGGAVGGIAAGLGLVPTLLVVGGVVLYLKGWTPARLLGVIR